MTTTARTYWYFIFRAMIAAAYITLVITDGNLATDLAFPYAAFVLIVAVNDLVRIPPLKRRAQKRLEWTD